MTVEKVTVKASNLQASDRIVRRIADDLFEIERDTDTGPDTSKLYYASGKSELGLKGMLFRENDYGYWHAYLIEQTIGRLWPDFKAEFKLDERGFTVAADTLNSNW